MNYIYTKYPRQNKPQGIYLFIDGDEQNYWIDCDYEIGNAVTSDVWHGRTIMLSLPSEIYSEKEAEEILEKYKEEIEKILDGYETEICNSNEKGVWNYDYSDLEENLKEEESVWSIWNAENFIQDSFDNRSDEEFYCLNGECFTKKQFINEVREGNLINKLDEIASEQFIVVHDLEEFLTEVADELEKELQEEDEDGDEDKEEE